MYVGGGNGDPSCHVSDHCPTRPAFHGLVLGLVRAGTVDLAGTVGGAPAAGAEGGVAAAVQVRVSAPGLLGSSVSITIIHPSPERGAGAGAGAGVGAGADGADGRGGLWETVHPIPWWCKGELQL